MLDAKNKFIAFAYLLQVKLIAKLLWEVTSYCVNCSHMLMNLSSYLVANFRQDFHLEQPMCFLSQVHTANSFSYCSF